MRRNVRCVTCVCVQYVEVSLRVAVLMTDQQECVGDGLLLVSLRVAVLMTDRKSTSAKPPICL